MPPLKNSPPPALGVRKDEDEKDWEAIDVREFVFKGVRVEVEEKETFTQVGLGISVLVTEGMKVR